MINSTDRIILKLLKKFNNNDNKKFLFRNFSKYIIITIKEKRISITYGEKILRHTFSYLIYCNYFKQKIPTQFSLEGYLWLHYQQKYFLQKFIEFLSKYYNIKLDLSKIKAPQFKRPKKSHQILKERVIYILKTPEDKHLTQKFVFDSFIGYFHWIYIPKNVYVSLKNIKQYSDKGCFLKINFYKFFFPKEIVYYLYKFCKYDANNKYDLLVL